MNNKQKIFGELHEVRRGAFKGCFVIPWKVYNKTYAEESLYECLICYDPTRSAGKWFFTNIKLALSNLEGL